MEDFASHVPAGPACATPRIRFLFIAPCFRVGLPPHPASRRRSYVRLHAVHVRVAGTSTPLSVCARGRTSMAVPAMAGKTHEAGCALRRERHLSMRRTSTLDTGSRCAARPRTPPAMGGTPMPRNARHRGAGLRVRRSHLSIVSGRCGGLGRPPACLSRYRPVGSRFRPPPRSSPAASGWCMLSAP